MAGNTPAPVRVAANPKWIRGVRQGRTIVDSRRTSLVWEHRSYPAWYFPAEDIDAEIRTTGETFESTSLGVGSRCDLLTAHGAVARGAWRHPEAPEETVRDLIRIDWAAMDQWFEEDVEVFVHPRSPEVRVDALASSRHVRVLLDGTMLADSHRPVVLYETGLPPRYYLPQHDVRMDMLTASATSSACPYKGWAHYWDVATGTATHADLAWGYRTPLPESAAVAGLVCFYNENVDLEIDGVLHERPVTKFS